MSEEKKYEMKEPKENLHWINYSMKKLLEEMKKITPLLADIKECLTSTKGEGSAKKRDEECPF